ncbi:MAG: hypothetical protein C4617_03575 [Candidatus Liberibacter europaeus]|uniref:Uncharacterized protein n=1 Tax=Candidatus Liberibacter europaeus TaxID=744859 RepID=A0A2T4VXI3_9HYPH|nr:hypothetical protein [Candidatus Liberibacter europaeus]PTL86485.1 MAG: hypothetical protein C4617_03575 [Candidatus Liberibacter europaeus]
MSIKKISTFSIITTSLLNGCNLSESKKHQELIKKYKQNQQTSETTVPPNDSNANNLVVGKEPTSDNPIAVPSVNQTSEDSSNQNESIISENRNSSNPVDIIENRNEVYRQLDEVIYMIYKLQLEIDKGNKNSENMEQIQKLRAQYDVLDQKRIQANQDLYDLNNNPNSSADKRFDFILSSTQEIEEAANFFRRDDDLKKNKTALEEMYKKEDSQWKNKYDNFLKEYEKTGEKYKNITLDEKRYIIQKSDEIRERL